jgi:hypothetical protein
MGNGKDLRKKRTLLPQVLDSITTDWGFPILLVGLAAAAVPKPTVALYTTLPGSKPRKYRGLFDDLWANGLLHRR